MTGVLRLRDSEERLEDEAEIEMMQPQVKDFLEKQAGNSQEGFHQELLEENTLSPDSWPPAPRRENSLL